MSNKQNTKHKNLASNSAPKASKRSAKSRSRKSAVGPKTTVAIRVDRKLTSRGPTQTRLNNGGIRIEMEEFVSPIFKPVTSASNNPMSDVLLPILRLRINPGSSKTFTWLSSIAVNYENYKFLKCEFIYLNRVGQTTTGSVIMSPDYDAEDGFASNSEKALFSNKGTTDESVCIPHTMRLNPASMHRLYKSHAVMSDERFATTDQDVKTVDCAQVQISLDTDVTTAVKYGKLIVKYIVELTEPQNPTEPDTKGGFYAMKDSANLVVGTAPFNNFIPLKGLPGFSATNGISIDPGLMKAAVDLVPQGATLPSAVLGVLSRDWKGVIDVVTTGTGLSGFPSMYVGSTDGMNLPAGSVYDRNQAIDGNFSIVNSTATDSRSKFNISGKAGEIIKIATGTAATISGMRLSAGGVLNQILDL